MYRQRDICIGMKPKYIEGSLMLTKEAFTQYIENLKAEKAKTYGMTLEQWNNAIASGSAIIPKDDTPRMW